MKFHPATIAAVVRGLSPLVRDWREIIAICEDRARLRQGILAERRVFGYIQDKLVGMEE
jgi:hypothetical protein